MKKRRLQAFVTYIFSPFAACHLEQQKIPPFPSHRLDWKVASNYTPDPPQGVAGAFGFLRR